MPTSQAALDGIRVNGMKWRFRGPKIKELTAQIGQFNNNGIADLEEGDQLTQTANRLAKVIGDWFAMRSVPQEIKDDFERRHTDDIQFLEYLDVNKEVAAEIYSDPSEAIEEIVQILDELYDTFDYHRILIQ